MSFSISFCCTSEKNFPENVIIPEAINGYKVTSLTFDGDGITSIFIPETVNNISGNITSKLFNKCLITSTIIIVISLMVYCVSILSTRIFEVIDKVYLYINSIIYLIINYILGIVVKGSKEYDSNVKQKRRFY